MRKIESFSMADLRGCSARQIGLLSGLAGKALEKGVPLQTIQTWLVTQANAR